MFVLWVNVEFVQCLGPSEVFIKFILQSSFLLEWQSWIETVCPQSLKCALLASAENSCWPDLNTLLLCPYWFILLSAFRFVPHYWLITEVLSFHFSLPTLPSKYFHNDVTSKFCPFLPHCWGLVVHCSFTMWYMTCKAYLIASSSPSKLLQCVWSLNCEYL